MEWLSVEMLSRMQFAVAVFFHFLFVPLTLGLSLLIAVMQTIYYRTGDERYKRLVRFWGRLFLINFAVGVVTGISLVFQFGTNWSRYSEYVGGVFGPLLAIEATVAFFLESTFIAVWHFGWERVSKKLHLASIWLVTLAGNISAIWIILANGWMQNPVGYTEINGVAQLANLGDFLTVISNPYAWGQFFHTILGAWVLGGFFVLGISAWLILQGKQADLFSRCVKIAAPFTLAAVLCLMLVGHLHGNTMSRVQPTKLAAMELLWDTQKGAPFYIFQWPDVENERNAIELIPIPGMLSFLAYSDFEAEVQGLKDFPKQDRPPVLPVFLSFRLMVALGGLFLLLAALACLYRKDLGKHRLTAWMLFLNLPLPYIAIAAGWMLAEVGRQPWIIYGLKRTSEMASPIPASSVGISLLAFTMAYAFLGVVALYLMRKTVMQGAEAPSNQAAEPPSKQVAATPSKPDGGENHA
ncbi:MAG: cytochrome ubiquinol oxidase subunit I [Deltaproteobacteria bacterium]|jgi:cytochrome d ubiquinol oxidase subunit I|nr:cytochrome ubiquinol oxidase subunit I [Deltaproteobacteria bacterium]